LGQQHLVSVGFFTWGREVPIAMEILRHHFGRCLSRGSGREQPELPKVRFRPDEPVPYKTTRFAISNSVRQVAAHVNALLVLLAVPYIFLSCWPGARPLLAVNMRLSRLMGSLWPVRSCGASSMPSALLIDGAPAPPFGRLRRIPWIRGDQGCPRRSITSGPRRAFGLGGRNNRHGLALRPCCPGHPSRQPGACRPIQRRKIAPLTGNSIEVNQRQAGQTAAPFSDCSPAAFRTPITDVM
jgi:hypothetical protein